MFQFGLYLNYGWGFHKGVGVQLVATETLQIGFATQPGLVLSASVTGYKATSKSSLLLFGVGVGYVF